MAWSCATTGPSAERQLLSLELANLESEVDDPDLDDGNSEYMSVTSEDEELVQEEEEFERELQDEIDREILRREEEELDPITKEDK